MNNRANDAQEYFIDLFKSYTRNYNKIYSRKYSPSIRELLNDYIELYDDVANSPENKKLLNSLKAQLDVMEFFISDSILCKTIFKVNLNMLKNKIQFIKKNGDNNDSSSDYFAILKICSSLLKSLNEHNLYNQIISIVQSSTCYKEIDKCTECFINELLYDGYSIRYLQDWLRSKKAIHNNTSTLIKEFVNLKKGKNEYHIFFTVKNDSFSLNFKYISDKIKLQTIDKSKLPKNIEKHLLFNETGRAFEAVLYSMDEYSATYLLIKAFDSYCLIVNLMERKDYKINNKIASICNSNVNKFNIEANDLKLILPNIDNKEKNDLEDFLKYRDKVYEKNLAVSEIFTIERSLNILKNSNYENDENRLINLWNVLESILSYYSDDSIISKARCLIPKLMCLYYLKDKLNIFWNTLQKSRDYKEKVTNFIQDSINEKIPNKYDITKLINNIKTYGEELCEYFGTNRNILCRQYKELGMIIERKKDLRKDIEKLHKKIEYDIVRIYRTRNILVHSGNTTKTNILLKNARLMQYISNLMGVILHYKMKNSNHTISEILYSIPETYNCYLKDCDEFMKNSNKPVVEIFKPTYLFL